MENGVIIPDAVESLLEAIHHGRTDILKTILDKVKLQAEESNILFCNFLNQILLKDGNTFLHLSVKKGLIDLTRTLLKEGSDPSIKDSDGNTAYECSETEESTKQAFHQEFLQSAAASDVKALSQFLNSGINPLTAVDSPFLKNGVLHWAATFGTKEVTEFLSEKMPIDVLNAHGVTPLHDAVVREDYDIVQVLLKKSANPDIIATGGKLKGKSPRDLAKNKISNLLLQNKKVESKIVNGNNKENGELENVVRSLEEKIDEKFEEISDERLRLLWPPPKSIRQLNDKLSDFSGDIPLTVFSRNSSVTVHDILELIDTYSNFTADCCGKFMYLNEQLPESSIETPTEGSVQICFSSGIFHRPGAYRIVIRDGACKISCGNLEGLRYSFMTLIQLMRIFKEENSSCIPSLIVVDEPYVHFRGVLIDMNKFGRVPSVALFFSMIDIWSYLKLNHLHFFIRLSKGDSWPLPYSKINLMSIDRYCSKRGINFVPAIDVGTDILSFRDAETIMDAFTSVVSSFHSSNYIHLGPRLTSLVSSSSNILNILLSPLNKNTTVMLCSNSIQNLDVKLSMDIIYLQYGLHKSMNTVSALNSLEKQGLNVAVCTGTNAWSSLSGFPSSMTENHRILRSTSKRCEELGFIIAHWSSDPPLNHTVFAWPGFVTSAGMAWNSTNFFTEDWLLQRLPSLLNSHVFFEEELGLSIIELGIVEEEIPFMKNGNGSLLRILTHTDEASLNPLKNIDVGYLIQKVRKIQMKITQLKNFEAENDSLKICWKEEVLFSSEMILLSLRIARALVSSQGANKTFSDMAPTFKTDIANRLLSIIEDYKRIWSSKYILSGLGGSIAVFSSLFKRIIPDESLKSS